MNNDHPVPDAEEFSRKPSRADAQRSALELAEPILKDACYQAWENCEIGYYEEYDLDWDETLRLIVETDEQLREFEDGTLNKRGELTDPRVKAYRAVLGALGKRKEVPA